MRQNNSTRRVQGYCALCWSKCGCISVVENNRLVAVEPDRQHPTGQALCAKGRAAPELVNHEDRLLYPLKRTRPKGDPDPGWERIGWNEALDTISSKLKEISDDSANGRGVEAQKPLVHFVLTVQFLRVVVGLSLGKKA